MINSYKKNNIKKSNKKDLILPVLLVSQLFIISFALLSGGILYKNGVFSYWSDDIKKKHLEVKNNFISYFSSDIPKYKIKLNFLNMRELQISKLNAIKNKGIGDFSSSKFVNSILTIDKNPEKYYLKMRLKGTNDNHFRHPSSWSFKVRTKNISQIFNNNEFSFQHINTRSGIAEYAFQKFLEYENLFFHRIKLVNLILNNQSLGAYYIIDGYSKYLIEANRKREGVIFEYDKSDFVEHLTKDRLTYEKFLKKSFKTSQVKALKNTKPEKFNELRNFGEKQLRSLQSGELNFSDIFEYKDAAKVIAIRAIFGSKELDWRDMKFYLNPITMKLELISREIHSYDSKGTIYLPKNWWYLDPYKVSKDEESLISILNKDNIFMAEYIKALNNYSKKEVLDDFFNNNNEIFIIDNKINKFNKSKFDKKGIYKNAAMIREELYKTKKLNIYNPFRINENGKEIIKLSVSNIINFPIKIACINSNKNNQYCPEKETIIYPKNNSLQEIKFLKKNTKKLSSNSIEEASIKINYSLLGLENFSLYKTPLQSSFKPNKFNFYNVKDLSKEKNIFSKIDPINKIINFTKEEINLYESLLIPEGYKLIISKSNKKITFFNDSFLLIKGSLLINGEKDAPVLFKTNEDSSGSILIMNGKEKSIINYADFYNFGIPKSPYKNISGSLTIYNSNISISNSRFYKNKSGDDYINAFRSKVKIDNLIFKGVIADAIDLDFCNGSIKNSKFIDIGNDAIDFSGSEVEVENIFANNVKDKVISAGEKSFLNINNLDAQNSEIVIASKDSSVVRIKNISSKNNKHIFALYNKKPEFNGGMIYTDKKTINNYSILKDKESKIIIGSY